MDRPNLSQIREFVGSIEVATEPRRAPPRDGYNDQILPFSIYRGTRKNIIAIGDQINKSYEWEIYDGCAVLMRRLVEVLLILAYKFNKIETEIRDADGNYLRLSAIINKAKSNKVLDLSRSARANLDPFRITGGLSAHNLYYVATQPDIDKHQLAFRQVVEELLHKAGVIS